MMSSDRVRLEDAHVRLEPLSTDHVDALTHAANEDRSTYDLAPVPRDQTAMRAYVDAALADRAAIPFAIVAKAPAERVVGSMRFMNLEWWTWPAGPVRAEGEPRRRDAGDPPDVVEIGHVWLARSAQRTVVNSAACLLLMRHAFEAWRVNRLVLKTDARNERSRAAIHRVGGVFEGILRQHQPAADGIVRDTAMFSITRAEWPAVERRLDAAVKRPS
ncbi:MAG: acetyltransferase, ribosomal protein N-acetylase [Labilithrix sp.]|nr:acetyltransferase, ribosomal protein N-acetylase [Labilithrix sp.]